MGAGERREPRGAAAGASAWAGVRAASVANARTTRDRGGRLRVPLDTEGPARGGHLDRLDEIVEHAPAGRHDALAELGDRLVMVGLRGVDGLTAGARGERAGLSRTSWSALSKEPSARRWSVWPTSSGRCWTSVPPSATFISCMPRQIPSTGRSRFIARSARAISAWSRSGRVLVVLGWRRVAVGARVDVRAAGQDEAVEPVEHVVGVLGHPRVRRDHQRDRAGHLQRVDVGAREQERLAIPYRPARPLQGGAEADAGSSCQASSLLHLPGLQLDHTKGRLIS